MKSRRNVRTNRRKFRATKSKVYRKSRRNARKIMRGGTPENVGTHNINELDMVGPDSDNEKSYNLIQMKKIFDSEEAANAFVDEAKKSIGEEHITNHWVEPFGNKMKEIPRKEPGKWFGTKTVIQKVPAQYSVIMNTNYMGKELAKKLVTENLPDTKVMVK